MALKIGIDALAIKVSGIEGMFGKIVAYLTSPLIVSGFAAAFLAAVTWMLALSKLELSYAYPFMSLNFVIVTFLSIFILGETASFHKLAGLAFIVLGTVISSQ